MYQSCVHSQLRRAAVGALGAMALTLSAASASADAAKCVASISKNTAKYEEAVQKALGICRDGNAKSPSKVPSCPDAKASGLIGKALTKLQTALSKDCAGETPATLGFAGLVNRCAGGTRDGEFCTKAADCEGECAGGGEPGAPCTSNANCPTECIVAGMHTGASCKGGGATECANMGGVCNDPLGAGSCSDPAPGTCSPVDRCPNMIDGSAPFADCDAALANIDDVTTCVACNAAATANVVTGFAYDARRPASTDPAYGNPTGDEKTVLACKRALGKAVGAYYQTVRKATQKCTADQLKGKVPSCPDAKLTAALATAKTKLTGAITKKCTDAVYAETASLKAVLAVDPLADPLALPNSSAAFGDAASALAGTLASCSDSFAVPSVLTSCESNCGNGQVDLGEDCDDGNVVNGDSCPADCHLTTTCAVSGTVTVTVTVNVTAPITPLGALTTYLAYDGTKVNLPGTGSAATLAISTGAFGVSANDLDYAVRVVLVDPWDVGTPPYTIQFNKCGAAAVSAADFNCMVEDAADAASATTEYGVACSVNVM